MPSHWSLIYYLLLYIFLCYQLRLVMRSSSHVMFCAKYFAISGMDWNKQYILLMGWAGILKKAVLSATSKCTRFITTSLLANPLANSLNIYSCQWYCSHCIVCCSIGTGVVNFYDLRAFYISTIVSSTCIFCFTSNRQSVGSLGLLGTAVVKDLPDLWLPTDCCSFARFPSFIIIFTYLWLPPLDKSHPHPERIKRMAIKQN